MERRLRLDAIQRDFAISALYFDPRNGDLFDFHGGLRDLRDGIVRCIGDPRDRFIENPLAMMRAIRIALKLRFEIADDVLAAIRETAPLIAQVSSGRLNVELMRHFYSANASDSLAMLKYLNLHPHILPQLAADGADSHGANLISLLLVSLDEAAATGTALSSAFVFATILWPSVLAAYRQRLGEGIDLTVAMQLTGAEVLDDVPACLALSDRWDMNYTQSGDCKRNFPPQGMPTLPFCSKSRNSGRDSIFFNCAARSEKSTVV